MLIYNLDVQTKALNVYQKINSQLQSRLMGIPLIHMLRMNYTGSHNNNESNRRPHNGYLIDQFNKASIIWEQRRFTIAHVD